MPENKYDKYRIEELQRINSRFYLIELHRKSYVIDYYEVKKLRNFFPFSTLYNNNERKAWNIYEVDNIEEEFNTSPIRFGNVVPSSAGKFSALVLLAFFLGVSTFPLLIILIFLCIGILTYLIVLDFQSNSKILCQLNKFPKYQLLPVINKKRSKILVKISNGISLGISASIVLILVSAITSVWDFYFISVFLMILSSVLGRLVSGIPYIPETGIKYQIIEKEEN